MSKLSVIIAFSLGAAAGSVVSWRLLKKKYERIAQEEIDSVKGYFSERKYTGPQDADEEAGNEIEVCEDEEPIDDDKAYDTLTSAYRTSERDEYNVKPYVIPSDEFDILDDYTVETLTLYSDGVLTDQYDDIVKNIESLIGKEAIDYFEDPSCDSLFVRNDILKCDFEILRDLRSYTEVVG